MNHQVIVKSSRYGLTVYLDPDVSFVELLKEIEKKFQDSAKFFREAKMTISFEGRVLTRPEEQEIISLIEKIAQIQIICIIDTDERTERIYRRVIEDTISEQNQADGQFYRGTLKRKQILELETSVVILGDVELGAKVIAKGSVVVLGKIQGFVHAGAAGDKNAFICALSLRSAELRIADVECRRYTLTRDEDRMDVPKIAQIEGDHIYFDPLV